MWPSETAIIDGLISTGVFLSTDQGFALKEDPRDLRKYLDRYIRSGSKFAVIYKFLQSDGISHCAVLSDKPLIFGQNYTVQKLRRSAVGKSKKQAVKRTQKQLALDLVRKSLQLESVDPEPEYHTDRTPAEVRYALRIEESLILGTPLPKPYAVKTGLGAITLTNLFKSNFGQIWKPVDEKTVVIREPVFSKPKPATHGIGCGSSTHTLPDPG